jgi:hypothetical protein
VVRRGVLLVGRHEERQDQNGLPIQSGASQLGARAGMDVRAFDALPISSFSRRSAAVVAPEACSWFTRILGRINC